MEKWKTPWPTHDGTLSQNVTNDPRTLLVSKDDPGALPALEDARSQNVTDDPRTLSASKDAHP